MPAIPPTSDFNKSTIDKDTFHAKFLALHAYLTGLLASSGNAIDARSQLGLGSAATVNTGTASGNVPLVGTESATATVAGLVTLDTIKSFGLANSTQVVTDVKTSPGRALATTYTNTTGKPIFLAVVATHSTGGSITLSVNTISVVRAYASGSAEATITYPIPPGANYEITGAGMTLVTWTELR